MNDLFSEFIGKEVKVPYRDGSQYKIARGILESVDGSFVKISGHLGIIAIQIRNIERIAEASKNDTKSR